VTIAADTFGAAWRDLLAWLYHHGFSLGARGYPARELCNIEVHVTQALANILVNAARQPSYRFMVAEWLWIWFGRDDVATIKQYNTRIADFSDNGIDFNGAYGVPVREQWPRLLELLTQDPETRQAVLSIYRVPKGPTKDVPCTIAAQFLLRRRYLQTIVTMRSSDIWLGLPYDFFNFSQLANILSAQLRGRGIDAIPGSVTFHLGSSHLYDVNLDAASRVLDGFTRDTATLTSPLFLEAPPAALEDVLVRRAVDVELADPWAAYARVLTCLSPRGAALTALREVQP